MVYDASMDLTSAVSPRLKSSTVNILVKANTAQYFYTVDLSFLALEIFKKDSPNLFLGNE